MHDINDINIHQKKALLLDDEEIDFLLFAMRKLSYTLDMNSSELIVQSTIRKLRMLKFEGANVA